MKEGAKALVVSISIMLVGGVILGLGLHQLDRATNTPDDRASSFVGYSQSCWQIGDTLHVVTAKGDTIKLDVSRLEELK